MNYTNIKKAFTPISFNLSLVPDSHCLAAIKVLDVKFIDSLWVALMENRYLLLCCIQFYTFGTGINLHFLPKIDMFSFLPCRGVLRMAHERSGGRPRAGRFNIFINFSSVLAFSPHPSWNTSHSLVRVINKWKRVPFREVLYSTMLDFHLAGNTH